MTDSNPPGSWTTRRSDVPQWKQPFLFFDWCCEWIVYWLDRWALIKLLGFAGRLAILFSVVSFAWNYSAAQEARTKAKHYQAWQVIALAYGKPGGGGRGDALEDLVKDSISLENIDLTSAVLRSANLNGANLIGANLLEANLSGAALAGAALQRTNLAGAKLLGANLKRAVLTDAILLASKLSDADLHDANLEKANLAGADVTNADLTGATLLGANLWMATLRGAILSGTKLTNANLLDANLLDARGITCSQLQKAKNWSQALRGNDIACGEAIPERPNG